MTATYSYPIRDGVLIEGMAEKINGKNQVKWLRKYRIVLPIDKNIDILLPWFSSKRSAKSAAKAFGITLTDETNLQKV